MAAPSAEGAAAGSSSALDVDTHGGLFGLRSILGGLGVLLVLCFFGFGLQAINDAVRASSGFSVGAQTEVTDKVAFTAAPGWANDPSQSQTGIGVVATKNGWEMKLAGGIKLQPGQSIEDWGKIFHDVKPQDPGAKVTKMVTFKTDSGLHGVSWEVHGANTSSATWMVAGGSDVAQLISNGPSSSFAGVQPELEQMAKSITIKGSGGSQ